MPWQPRYTITNTLLVTIRRIGEASLLISDNHGINFLVRDMFKIDKGSRKILDRFL